MWPVNQLTIGSVTYTKAQLLTALQLASSGNKCVSVGKGGA